MQLHRAARESKNLEDFMKMLRLNKLFIAAALLCNAAPRDESSGAKHQESAYFIRHQRDPLHAWTCLQV